MKTAVSGETVYVLLTGCHTTALLTRCWFHSSVLIMGHHATPLVTNLFESVTYGTSCHAFSYHVIYCGCYKIELVFFFTLKRFCLIILPASSIMASLGLAV